jgi:1,4-alpha-glucan branching enzyme
MIAHSRPHAVPFRHLAAGFALCFAAASAALPAAAQHVPEPVGAIVKGAGPGRTVIFRVWAPNANSVTVRGDFDNWREEKMNREAARTGGGATGYWFLESRKARPGDKYMFRVDGNDRRDPAARALAHVDRVAGGTAAVVVDASAFRWDSSVKWETPPANELVVYQLHPGTFAAGIGGHDSVFLKCLKRLPYLKELGVNAIQLLPVNEFNGDHSWGYNPSDTFAVERAYGGGDDFRTFVQECHRNGFAVLLDIVHNHYGDGGNPQYAAIWQFDSSSGRGSYFYPNGIKADTEWGPRPDYSRQEVRDWIHASVKMFLEEYRLDGFRWDSIHNVRYVPADGEAPNPDGDRLLKDVNEWMEKAYPRALRIAEDHAFDRGGVGFQAQWHSHFRNLIANFVATNDSARNVTAFAEDLKNQPSPPFRWVLFPECHDSAGDLNNHHRMPAVIDPQNPNSRRARALSLLANGIALTLPGIPMFLQGYEMNETADFSAQTPVHWAKADPNLLRAYADLIHLRRNTKGLTPGLLGDDFYLLAADPAAQVIAYYRRDSSKSRDFATVVVFNFSPRAHTAFPIRFPTPGNWYCHYNSALKTYCPDFDGVGLKPGGGFSLPGSQTRLPLDIGAWSMQIFSRTKPANASLARARPDVSAPASDVESEFEGLAEDTADVFRTRDPLAGFVEEILAPFPYIPVPLP